MAELWRRDAVNAKRAPQVQMRFIVWTVNDPSEMCTLVGLGVDGIITDYPDRLRTVMTVIYVADGARVLDEVTPAQEVDRKAWLGGRPLGALVDHELNPVI